MEIKVPVPIACIDAADIPPAVVTVMPKPDADIARKAAGAAADVRNLDREYRKLRAALIACAKGP